MPGILCGLCCTLLVLAGQTQAQNYLAEPLLPAVTLSNGFTPDPLVFEITPGGGSTVSPDCPGYIYADQADLRLDYSTDGSVSLAIISRSVIDTTLVVRDPLGQWYCNDDAPELGGIDAAVVLPVPASGSYHIWVGTLQPSDGTGKASLAFTELDATNWWSITTPGLDSLPAADEFYADADTGSSFDSGEESYEYTEESATGTYDNTAAEVLGAVSDVLNTYIALQQGVGTDVTSGFDSNSGSDSEFSEYDSYDEYEFDDGGDDYFDEPQVIEDVEYSGDSGISPGGSTLPGVSYPDYSDRSRIIAGDGRSAMHCVSLETVSSGDSGLVGNDGRVLANNCGESVEITWCYEDDGSCARGYGGGTWTLGSGGSWPVSAEKEVRYAACIGANTVHWIDGQHGYRFYCNAPDR